MNRDPILFRVDGTARSGHEPLARCLTYAAAVTSRIRLGASVVVLQIHSPLMVAHQWASLDYISNGRAILGVGIGRDPCLHAPYRVPGTVSP